MDGAREYAELFKTGQIGRFYITSGYHARGKTFRLQLLPPDEVAIPNGSPNTCLNKDAVEIYGIISGNPGWTEKYGWLHHGPWVADFEKIVQERKKELAREEAEKKQKQMRKAESEEQRIKRLLDNY